VASKKSGRLAAAEEIGSCEIGCSPHPRRAARSHDEQCGPLADSLLTSMARDQDANELRCVELKRISLARRVAVSAAKMSDKVRGRLSNQPQFDF